MRTQLPKRVEHHRQIFFARESARISEHPRARGQAELAPQRGRTALRRKRVDIDAKRPHDGALDAPLPQAAAHERAWREHEIAAAVELARIDARRSAGDGPEPPLRHLHDVAVAERDQRHVERTSGPQRGPCFGAGIADFDEVGVRRADLANPAMRSERPAMPVRPQRSRAQVALARRTCR